MKISFRQIGNYLSRLNKTNLNLEFPNCDVKDFFFFANAISRTLYLSYQDLAAYEHEKKEKWKQSHLKAPLIALLTSGGIAVKLLIGALSDTCGMVWATTAHVV